MIQIFVLSALIALLVALAGTYIAIRMQSRALLKLHVQQEAWQRAQEAQLRTWEVRQGSHALEVEKKLANQVKQVQENWRTWEIKDQQRIAAMVQEFEALMGKLNLEHELARLPHIDETPLPAIDHDQHQQPFKNWRPPTFCGADLSGRDLSHRYLVRADFREAQLRGTNFYMADLRGACLAGADLTGADLSGTDLSGADLRSAILNGVNLLVTDIRNAVLNGADLRGARNLTADQAYSAIFDDTTRFDEHADVTLPRIPSIRLTVYTESTPLVSLKSSEDVKQLELPPNSIEAAPVFTLPETTEKQPAVGEISPDASDTLQPPSTAQFEAPEPANQLLPDKEDTFELAIPESATHEELIDQLQTAGDSGWPIPGDTAIANGYANGNSANHAHNGAATNGMNGHLAQAPDLDSFTEQPAEDTLLRPQPSNGNSHVPMKKDPRSATQENRRTGGSGKANPRKGRNDRRRAKAN
ncbi:MAG TPA: pentapeptide repeat-containing protein [Ktedonobacteraceae bacterium]|nr:pentapeptide repeat-containing protein [Ktedonobacteraceae bacterium]